MSDPGGLWYTLKDLVRLFDVTERTIQRWVKEGKLPKPARMSRKWVRWPRKDIDRILRDMGGNPDDSRQ